MEGCLQSHWLGELLRLGLQACEQQVKLECHHQSRALEQPLETLGELQPSMRLSVSVCAIVFIVWGPLDILASLDQTWPIKVLEINRVKR